MRTHTILQSRGLSFGPSRWWRHGTVWFWSSEAPDFYAAPVSGHRRTPRTGSRMSVSADTVRPSTRFVRALVAIAIVALVWRVAYVLLSSAQVGGDGLYYHAIAGLVADGKGFIAPEVYAKLGQAIPTAPHPPGWPVVLIGAAFVGLRTTL